MAVIITSRSSDHSFSISNIISRFRAKKKTSSKAAGKQPVQQIPQKVRPPLITSPLPLVLPQHQSSLSNLGWTTITFPQPPPPSQVGQSSNSPPSPGPHPLQVAYEALFAASQNFFDLPASEKEQWKHKLGSEEGWSYIPGEKEFITLRSLEYCPDILKEPAKRYWDLVGAHLSSTLARISTSLGLPDTPDADLTQFVGPCEQMQDLDALKTATMIRLFRYESWEPKVVAEPHADLGLLSVVVGSVPGLEVWDGFNWFGIEREVYASGNKGATLLVGRQLEQLSNGRYNAGGHQVVSYGQPRIEEGSLGKYRFSIVFVLRAHEPVVVQSDLLETEITGKWEVPLKGVTAGQMYEGIRRRHFNINVGGEEREVQKKRIERMKAAVKG